MKKEVIITAIGPDDAFFEDSAELIEQKMTVQELHKGKTGRSERKYGWYGVFYTQEDITFRNGETLPAGNTLSFYDIDIKEV